MTLEILFLLFLIGTMIVLFLTERLPIDLTALVGLLILTWLGYLSVEQAFSGFSSTTVITLFSMFVVGTALTNTGLAAALARRVAGWVNGSEARSVLAVVLLAALLSSFMANMAATAILLPAVVVMAQQSGVSVSRLLLPLSFGSVLGGMTTLLGTPPNIVMADFMAGAGLEPFQFFSFTPFGLVAVGVGAVFMSVWGRRWLPRRNPRRATQRRARDLTSLYQVFERLFTLRVPPTSALVGRTIAASRFGTLLRSRIVAVVRAGQRRLYPRPDEVFAADDRLVVEGRLSVFQDLQRFQGLRVERVNQSEMACLPEGIRGVRLALSGKKLVGQSLAELDFRARFQAVVVGIERGTELLYRRLGAQRLAAGDLLLVLGEAAALAELSSSEGLRQQGALLPAAALLHDRLFVMEVPAASGLDGVALQASRMGELLGIQAVGILRNGAGQLVLGAEQPLCGGDRILAVGENSQVELLDQLSSLELDSSKTFASLEDNNIGVFEVVLSPHSRAMGKTLIEINFREKYDLQVLGIWRGGRPYRFGLSEMELELGDALLLHGPRSRLEWLAADLDFLVLSESTGPVPERQHSYYALGALFLMVLLSVTRIVPVPVAAATAALVVLLAGVVTLEQVYRTVNWRVLVLVAALIPLGLVVEETGAAAWAAQELINATGAWGPMAVLITISLLASLLSQGLDSSVSVVLLAPIALNTAQQLGVSPYPFLMMVALSASVAFITPFSHKAHLLVMGAGGYRVRDYLRIGAVLSLLLFIIIWVLVPILLPL